MRGLVKSPLEKIPLFCVTSDTGGARVIQYLNTRTGCTEEIKASRMVVYLLEAEKTENVGNGKIYSPQRHIPIGVLDRDKYGSYYIEVKFKKAKERIRISTYVSLLLESEELKAS